MIRRATQNDISDILNLLLQVLTVHHIGRPDLFKGNCRKYTEDELKIMVNDDSKPIFVFDNEQGLVTGYAFCVHIEHPNDNVLTDIKTLYIDDICVDEKHRHQGVASSLLNYVKQYAKENGYYNITLNVWECNPGADAFYRSQGMLPQKTGMEFIL